MQPEIDQEMLEPISKVLLHRTIIHQIFLCSMITSELNLELVHKMSRLKMPKEQFTEQYKEELLQWRDNTSTMKKEYIKREYCRFYEYPQIDKLIHQARLQAFNFDIYDHSQSAIKQFQTIAPQTIRKGSRFGLRKSKKDNFWSFRQLRCIYLPIFLQAGSSSLSLRLIQQYLPHRSKKQINQKIYSHFIGNPQPNLKITEQQQCKMKRQVIKDVFIYFDCCYLDRRLSHDKIRKDLLEVVKNSTKQAQTKKNIMIIMAQVLKTLQKKKNSEKQQSHNEQPLSLSTKEDNEDSKLKQTSKVHSTKIVVESNS